MLSFAKPLVRSWTPEMPDPLVLIEGPAVATYVVLANVYSTYSLQNFKRCKCNESKQMGIVFPYENHTANAYGYGSTGKVPFKPPRNSEGLT